MTIHPFPGRPPVEPQQASAALPPGYVQQGQDIYAVTADESGEPVPVRVCSLLRVLGRTSDTEGRSWGLVVEVCDQRGVWNRVVLPQADLNGSVSKAVRALSDRGLTLPADPKAKGRLVELLTQWPAPDHHLLVRRVGWTDETFRHFVVRRDRVIGGRRVILASGEFPAADRRAAGNLDSWRREVAMPCIGNPILIFAVSLAFTGPLLRPLAMAGGGAHLRGATTSGKSTAMGAALSVWGKPDVFSRWLATANGLEGLGFGSNDMLLGIDELGEIRGADAYQAAYMLPDGQGKARADATGATIPPSRWKIAIISTGEMTLRDKIAESGRAPMAGQEVRIVDVAADRRTYGAFDDLHGEPEAKLFAQALAAAMTANHGLAGPAFVERLLRLNANGCVTIRSTIMRLCASREKLMAGTGGAPVGRVLERFALVAIAGELATNWGLTGWPKGAATAAAMELFDAWFAEHVEGPSEEARVAETRLKDYLSAHGGSRFQLRNGPELPDRDGWCDDGFFHITAPAWSVIHDGADPKQAAQDLRRLGHLVPGDGAHLAAKSPGWVPGRPRLYKIRRSILGSQ